MFRLHSAQRSFLNYQNVHPEETNYYRSVALELTGDLNIKVLQQAIHRVANRHDMLRCQIVGDPGAQKVSITPTQPYTPLAEYIDATCAEKKPVLQLPQTLSAIGAEEFFKQPFKIDRGPLWRSAIVKISENQHQFVILCHPVIVDEKSINIWLNEIATYYNQIISGQHLELPAPIPPTEYDREEDIAARQLYWRKKLADVTALGLNNLKSHAAQPAARHHRFKLPVELISQMKERFPNHTLEQILLTAMYALLYRHTKDSSITLGATTANRPLSDRTINGHANWLTLPVKLNSSINFQDLLRNATTTHQDALKNQLAIDEIYQHSLADEIRTTLKSKATFDVLLTVVNKAPHMQMQGLVTSQPTQLDLGYTAPSIFHLTAEQLADGSCDCIINFNTKVLNEKHVERMAGHFEKILRAAATNPTQSIVDIPLLLESEARLIARFSETDATPYFGDQLLPEIFSSVAHRHPDAIAVVFHPDNGEPQRMKYRELEILSNQIANYLREHYQLHPGDIVAISMTRSINMVAFMLGAMKAGVTMAPLETAAGQLLENKLKSTKAALIIADHHSQQLFKNRNIPLLIVDDAIAQISTYDDTFYKPRLTPDSPAYIMYSSGTATGIPKGALLPQSSTANLPNALRNYNFPQHLSIYSTALITFDASEFDKYLAWAYAGTIHLTSDGERLSPEAAIRIITQEKINLAVFLPSFMRLLPPTLPLDYVISTGSEADEPTFAEWHRANPNRHLIDGRGHTETGICLALQEYKPETEIGTFSAPISNMKQFVLDEHYSICPIGISGDEYISGPGLATGYIDNPELTAKKFLHMQFDATLQKFIPCNANASGAVTLYATGDRGCYHLNANGEVCFKNIGRNDRVIKVYGVSTNPGGVEAMAKQYPHVQEITVMPMPDMSGLVAYVVRKPESRNIPATQFKTDLRTYLRKHTPLPGVHIPRHIILMTKLQKTPNGKIDYGALPKPPTREPYVPKPSQNLEQILTDMWREILGSDDVDELDKNTTFNELGGNSIELAMLENKINRHLPFKNGQRICVSKNFLSNEMTINSLAQTLRPLIKQDFAAPSKPLQSVKPASILRRNKSALFAANSDARGMNQNDASKSEQATRTTSFTQKK